MILLLIFGILSSCSSVDTYRIEGNIETEVTNETVESILISYSGKLATVKVEDVLYEGPNPDFFYIKVEIENTSGNTIGIDLSDKRKIFYPNQWGHLNTPERMIINEERIIPDELDRLTIANLKEKYKSQLLEFIKPNESFVYYSEFNANGKADIDETSAIGDYFFLSIDGQLFLTDGSECERICFEEEMKWNGNVVITKPLQWDKIENESLIINQD